MFAVSVFTLLLLLYDGWMDNWYRPVCTTSYKEVRSVPEITNLVHGLKALMGPLLP